MYKIYRPSRVLIVEDERIDKTILVKLIDSFDSVTRHTWVVSVEDAKDALREFKFDLVISDVKLEGTQSGFELRTYCQHYFPDLPFLMTSGLKPENYDRFLPRNEMGPLFLQKPFKPEECRYFLGSLLNKFSERTGS